MGITTLYRSLITLTLLVASLCSNAQTPNYQLPYYVRANWFSIRWTVPVTSYDSVYVKGINGWMATAPRTTWDNLPLKPTTFTPSAHTHTEYLTSFTEIDPTVSSTVKGITAAQVGNWNTAYLWGNHSGLYSLLGHTHTPSQVGLGNVNNTADIDKPISAATQLALDAIPAYAKSLTAFSVIKSSSDLLYYPVGNPNGYVTQAGARTAISLTTTGTGAATYNSTTGILNVPTPISSPGLIVNSATVGLTRAQLNTAYPNTPVGYMVLAPSITLGGAIYVRATTGASGVWQIISAPPVL